MAARLIVSLSGLSDDAPEPLTRGAAFAAALDARGVPLTQLFRPGGATPGSPLVTWLQQRRAAGDTVALHGYDHTADPIGNWQSSVARVGRRAEFATLPRHEAGLRLTAARRALTVLGLRTDIFVPPRWIASDGTVEALREQGFALLADETGVRFLDGPAAGVVLRARVLGFRASGEHRPIADDRRAAEAWRARVLAVEVARTARRDGLVRINVRAKDLKRPARRDAVLAAVDVALSLGAVPATYRLVPVARVA
ncbi:DUF2334 domain-containing protein [Pseudonocardia sp. GCM10023141]|uniref:DUF2334 domain-containing protein n=1 Tax=Pseudonocardia sp. GCM10023141 TaxID=3252653 RepID=UPI003623CBE8